MTNDRSSVASGDDYELPLWSYDYLSGVVIPPPLDADAVGREVDFQNGVPDIIKKIAAMKRRRWKQDKQV